jgi:Domain of unknown function (DUF1905)
MGKTGLTRHFRAELWRYDGPGGWYFLTLPQDLSAELRALSAGTRSAWGSLRVAAQIGQSRWETSLFPDKARGAYLLPVKAAIRRQENLAPGAPLAITLWPSLAPWREGGPAAP